ncbi:hypothetical protein AAF712_011084 [Marasmius tenuissimus]|uniref:DUF6593 domain-containing protein n=1 Tax=Marasmius tenuissimus TaxID=585030 RepID=A0ABR2ZM82_9AGAR
MDLLFTKDSPVNTTLSLPSGSPVYEISTPLRNFHTETTTIRKYRPAGGDPDDIGLIEIHSFHKDVCQLRGKDFLPKSPSMWKSTSFFTSSNGEAYTWHCKSDTAVLNDKGENTVAMYERSHSGLISKNSQPAKLSISVEGMDIIDEIVLTFAYVEQQEQIHQRAAGSSSAASASAVVAVC